MKVSQAKPIIDFITVGGNGQTTFIIPVYQRNYEWAKENCDQLFEDVINSIPKPGETPKSHYFGNIVYDESEIDPFTNYIQFILIDGQQRITSTMLLLAAIRDEEVDEDLRNKIDSTYLKNQNAEEGYRVKLKQVEMDRETFAKIIERDEENTNKNSAIYINYSRFRTLIREAKQERNITSKDILLGLRALNIIAIDLESKLPGSESPQVIFESINATGKPLSPAALLRNYLLLKIGLEKQESYYKEYWLDIEKRIGNDNISDFLRRYLTLRLHRDVKSGTEYKTFKKYYSELFIDAEKAMDELKKYSKYYQWITDPSTIYNSDDVKPAKDKHETVNLLQEADMLRLIPANATLMWILEKVDTNQIEFEEVNSLLKVIMDWVFRARVTGIIATGEIGNILTTGILKILEDKPKDDERSLSEYLYFELSNYRERDIYPNDKTFKEAFIKYNFYKNYGRYVQLKLAEKYSNDKHIELDTIEHILPQTLDQEKWPNISTAEHAEWVNTIGNLVPMNQPDNSYNSNNSYDIKLPTLDKSDWRMTRESHHFAQNDNWTIQSIKDRANELANTAVTIWKAPLERTRDIEVSKAINSNENMIKLINLVRNFALPNIIINVGQEKNSCYLNFSTDTLNNIYGSNDSRDIYTYAIVLDDGIHWDRVQLTLNNTDLITPERRKVHDAIIDIAKNNPQHEDWKYFKAFRWSNPTEDYDDEDEMAENLQKILAEKIPELEQRIKEHINNI